MILKTHITITVTITTTKIVLTKNEEPGRCAGLFFMGISMNAIKIAFTLAPVAVPFSIIVLRDLKKGLRVKCGCCRKNHDLVRIVGFTCRALLTTALNEKLAKFS